MKVPSGGPTHIQLNDGVLTCLFKAQPLLQKIKKKYLEAKEISQDKSIKQVSTG
jgi:hypothetical protein